MKNQTWILIAVLVLFIPIAFLGGKGCAPQTYSTKPVHDTLIVHGLVIVPQAVKDSTPRPAYRITATPISDLSHPRSQLTPSDTFDVCAGARLPFGDSAYICLHLPQQSFTVEQFLNQRITEMPALRPPAVGGASLPRIPQQLEVLSPPLHTLFYGVAATSTRDILMIGAGMETTAATISVDSLGHIHSREKLRIAGEAMILPKPPFAYLGVRAYYFF